MTRQLFQITRFCLFVLNTVAPTVQVGFKFKDIFFSFLLLKSLRYRIT